MPKVLRLLHSERFENVIWKVAVGSEAILGIESRDQQNLQVKFDSFDLQSLETKPLPGEDFSWWLSLLSINSQEAYFKRFESEKDPFRQKILKYSFENMRLSEVDGETNFPVNKNFGFPVQYVPGSGDYNDLDRFLRDQDLHPVKSIEYFQTENWFAIGFYQQQTVLQRWLRVWDKNGETLLNECLNQEMNGVAYQGFITFSNLLIFVQDNHEIRLYQAD